MFLFNVGHNTEFAMTSHFNETVSLSLALEKLGVPLYVVGQDIHQNRQLSVSLD